jgi:Tol biopolymer transport system component/DNA-binding winged helix-turn-helix (wHTH) protein
MSDTSAPVPRLVRFGVFEIDLRSGELRKAGARLNLQQQPLQLLSVLLEKPGELVTREELRKRLWPDDTFVDFEHGLNAAVKRLRDTLGDSADSPRFVETVPRRGYRFIAPTSDPNGPAVGTGRGAGRWPVRWAWAIAGVGVAGAIALGIWAPLKAPVRENAGANDTSARGAPGPVTRLTTGSDLNTEPTLSPDGEWVAYASDRSGEGHLDIWVQRLSGGEPLRLTRDAADEREPTFSADGSRIAFRSERDGGGIYVIPAHTGGEARLLVRGGAHGPRFSPDGRWLAYATGPGRFSADKNSAFFSQTYLIPSTGGEPTRLLPDFVSVAWPIWSPDGRHLLLTARRKINEAPEWWVVAPDGQAPVKVSGVNVVTGIRFPVRPWSWIEGNRIVYSASLGGDSWNLSEVVIAPRTWVVSTEPRRLTTGADLQGHASIVRGTQLVFSSLTQTVNVWSVPVHANSGRVVGPARRVTATSTLQWWPSVSEDGRRLVFRGDKLATGGLWLRDLDTESEVLLVSSRAARGPVITADGSRVAYWSPENGGVIYAVPSSGGVSETLCTDCGDDSPVEDWSKDKTRLLFLTGNPTEVFVLDVRSGEKRRVLQRSPQYLWQAQFSPDDRWISVLEALDAQGRTQVWVVPFRDGSMPQANEWMGITSGEHWDDKPRWSPDGNLMYFTSERDGFHCLWAQRLRPDTKEPIGPAFSVHHFHSARLSMMNTGYVGLETAVARDKVFINLGELSGNIWTTRLQ